MHVTGCEQLATRSCGPGFSVKAAEHGRATRSNRFPILHLQKNYIQKLLCKQENNQ